MHVANGCHSRAVLTCTATGKNWRRRFFRLSVEEDLTGASLAYFRSHKGQHVLGSITLSCDSIVKHETGMKERCFSVTAADGAVLYMQAEVHSVR